MTDLGRQQGQVHQGERFGSAAIVVSRDFQQLSLPFGHLAGMPLKVLTQLGPRLALTQSGQCHPCLERRTVGAPGKAR